MPRLRYAFLVTALMSCSRDLTQIIGVSDECREDADCQAGAYLVCQTSTGRCVLSPLAVDDDGDGWTEVGGDCDDTNPHIAPTFVDVCDDEGVDDDCDGEANNTDRDRDGFIDVECGGDDCNDNDPAVSPLAIERCSDAVDQNCDGDPNNRDFDRDGYIDIACGGDDCNDRAPTVYPGATEICEDGVDQNCGPELPVAYNAAGGDRLCPDAVDDDGDGFNEATGGDCDDGDRRVYPGAAEACDFVDNDCSGLADENLGEECPHFDYGGADYTWGDATPFSWDDTRPTNPNRPQPFGVHFNIGAFTVPAASTIAVTRFQVGAELKGFGSISIDARTATILGTIDASASGYGGGGAGGGGGGPGSPGAAGAGTAGGANGTAGESGNPNFANGGPGGRGGGTFGGAGGATNLTAPVPGNCQDGLSGFGGAGQQGGYRAAASNGDTSTGPDVSMGSGGGGGGGGDGIYSYTELCPGVRMGGGGGGAGNRGGGSVIIRAIESVTLGPAARVRSNGQYCATGSGGNSGASSGGGGGSATSNGTSAGGSASCNPCGAGGRGGAGAGGGVLLSAASGPVTLQANGGDSAKVESLSGTTACMPTAAGGGTVKIFSAVEPAGGFGGYVGNVSAGRFCAGVTGEACSNVP